MSFATFPCLLLGFTFLWVACSHPLLMFYFRSLSFSYWLLRGPFIARYGFPFSSVLCTHLLFALLMASFSL